jgi:hypothetical protein
VSVTTIPRCDTCHKRHATDDDECPDGGEEGYMSRAELLDAFRLRDGVCLDCQTIWHVPTGDRPGNCDDCGRPSEPFGEDDL